MRHQGGAYVVGAEVSDFAAVIDGRGENSSFTVPEEAGIMANHSGEPNAELALPAGPLTFECSLVALEDIDVGAEIRIDYEPQGGGQYWGEGGAPAETDWRSTRTPPPPRSRAAPHRLPTACPGKEMTGVTPACGSICRSFARPGCA